MYKCKHTYLCFILFSSSYCHSVYDYNLSYINVNVYAYCFTLLDDIWYSSPLYVHTALLSVYIFNKTTKPDFNYSAWCCMRKKRCYNGISRKFHVFLIFSFIIHRLNMRNVLIGRWNCDY